MTKVIMYGQMHTVQIALELIKELKRVMALVTITSETDNWIAQLNQMERTLKRMMEAAK